MTAPTQFDDPAPAAEEPTTDGHRGSTDSPSSGVVPPGRVRMSDAQAVVDCVFDIAETVVSSQREITRRSLAAAQTATAAVANAVGDAYRRAGPAARSNGVSV